MRTPRLWVGIAVALVGCGDANLGDSSPSVTLANLNLVHGLFCPPDTDACRLPDRVELMLEFVRAAGCPDVVTLQEIWPPSAELIEARAGDVCPFPYEVVLGEIRTDVDDELVLSRYPVEIVEQRPLFGRFRRVLWTRIAHPTGPLDVYSTHLASGADGGPNPCGDDCPAECRAAGAETVRDCQAVQMAEFIEQTHDVSTAALAAGDFNARPGSFVYRQFTERGWGDTYLDAGNPECDPATGIGCTSGRESERLDELESPERNVTHRIDFVFLIPARPEASCQPVLLPARGLGPGTQLWTEVPNPFAPACGPLPEPICWASDHTGVQVALGCA